MEEEKKDSTTKGASKAPSNAPIPRAIWSAMPGSARKAAVSEATEATEVAANQTTTTPRKEIVPSSPTSSRPIAPWSASQRIGREVVRVENFRREDDAQAEAEEEKAAPPPLAPSVTFQTGEAAAVASMSSSSGNGRPASSFPQIRSNSASLSQRLHRTMSATVRSDGAKEIWGRTSASQARTEGYTSDDGNYGSDDEHRETKGKDNGGWTTSPAIGETLTTLKVTLRPDADNEYLRKRNQPESIANVDPTTIPEYEQIADGMTLTQVSDYLGTHGFLHCTPRYNVERVDQPNFYDLVVLEMPGHNPTGYVWMKKFGGSKDTYVLEPHQLLQLSLDGVISASAKDSQGLRDVELLSLRDLLREREIMEKFVHFRFFSHFREARVLYAWHLVARSRRLRASRRNLLENGLFCDRPVYDALAYIRNVTHELEDVELFHFSGRGSQTAIEYLREQMVKIFKVQKSICQRIESISVEVGAQHAIVTGDDYLRDILDKIKEKHPFLPADAAGLEIEWAKVRSLQRARDKGHKKIESVLLIAQFMIEHSMAFVLERFWNRFRYLLRGIREVDDEGLWDMEDARAHPLFEVVPESTSLGDEKLELVHHHDAHHFHRHRHFHRPHHHHEHISGLMQPVTREWEEQGSHLHLDVNLCLDLTPLSLQKMLQTTNTNRLKVRAVPFRLDFLDQVHALCGSLSSMLDALPNMKRHRLVTLGNFTEPNPADFEEEEASTAASARFFSILHMSPILSSRGSLKQALDLLRAAQLAYADASSLTILFRRTQDTAKKLWSLNPDSLAQQLQRSIVMSKVREIVSDPESVDDIKRAMTRDQNRLSEVIKAAEYLDTTGRMLVANNPNIKHGSGLITSFQAVTQQLQDFISAAEHKLFTRLPMAFSTRVRNFTDYLKTLQDMFEVKNNDFDESIFIMQKLKNFECARDAFDVEVEVVETMHSMTHEYEESEKSAINRAKAGAFLSSSQGTTQNSRNTKKSLSQSSRDTTTTTIFQQYIEGRERLLLMIGKGRNSLLAQLSTIKSQAFARRRTLRERISAEFNAIDEAEKNERNDTGKLFALEKCGKRIAILSKDVEKMIATQTLLLEAHEIVGSATPVLLPVEVEQFEVMVKLQTFCNAKIQSLKCLNDVKKMKRDCLNSKIGSSQIWVMGAELDKHIVSIASQAARKEEAATLELVAEQIEELRPKLEVATFFSSECLRTRHWKWLGEHIFSHCSFSLKFAGASSEIISVVDTSGKEPVGMGSLTRMSVNEFWQRGIERHLSTIRRVTSEALMEEMIESTLGSIDEVLRTMTVEQSGEWISNSRMREKVGYELNQVTNLTQLSVTLCYCRKTVLVLENLSRDMNISCFDAQLEKSKILLFRLERFVNNLHEIQHKWLHMFHFVKFSDRGEIDKDTNRLYQICTEELKKMDGDFSTKQKKLLSAFESLTDGDKSTNILKNNLSIVMEDSHSSIQSLLDAVPRLSLLSYHKIVLLVKLWADGPEQHLDFISACMHDMFDGVGHLSGLYNLAQNRVLCIGCRSYDNIEHIVFTEPISFNAKLEDFIEKFEFRLKEVLSNVADGVIVARVKTLQSMLREIPLAKALGNIRMIFGLRMKQTFQMASDKGPNQSYSLVNSSIFAEDVWLCLGHPMGSIAIAKHDYVDAASLFQPQWRASLEALLLECKENITLLLKEQVRSTELNDDDGANLNSLKMVFRKSNALLSALLAQEISFSSTLEELIAFKCLESAAEHWAGRYQLHFLYDREERTKQSPFDVGLGCVTIPYGLEYHGGFVRVLPDGDFERVLEQIIGASASSRASILINQDSNPVPWEAVGEHSVSCRDVASAFGRVLSTLVSVEDIQAVKLFLSRLVYLDAVGCVDFTSIHHAGLQTLMGGLAACWGAIQTEDIVINDWMKFPIKTKTSKTEVQVERSRDNIHNLRMHLLNVKSANVYSGIIVVGIASESFYTDEAVLDYATRSIFTTIACGHSRPIEALGLLFSWRGFIYGMEIQSMFISTIKQLSILYGKNRHFIRYICSRQIIVDITEQAGAALFARHLGNMRHGTEDVFTRLKAEIDVFAAVLWEAVLNMGDNHGIPIATLRKDMFLTLQTRLDSILPNGILGKKIVVETEAGSNSLFFEPSISAQIRSSARDLSYVMGEAFAEGCGRLWGLISCKNNCLVILSGESGCGKSTIRKTIAHAIEHGGVTGHHHPLHGGSKILYALRAMLRVRAFARRWLNKTRFRMRQERAQANAETEGEDVPFNDEDNESDEGVIHDKETAQSQADNEEHLIQKVFSSVIYHASLSYTHLLGGFDRDGRWSDGILLRKFREIDDHLHNIEASHSDANAFHLIVLDGPLGFYAEQVFSSSLYHQMDARVLHKEQRNCHLVFPSGEHHSLPKNVMVVLETDDLSHASPALLSSTPHLHISANVELSVSRIISTWCKSLKNWLGYYPSWADTLEEIIYMVRSSQFVHDMLYFDFSPQEMKPSLAISRVSAFLRIVEELLNIINIETAKVATFHLPERDKLNNESSDEDEKEKAKNAVFLVRDFSKQVMSLNFKQRDVLTQRAMLAIAYAGIWGFGGCVNGTERRKFFDSVARDAIDRHFRIPVDVTDDCNVFDASLNLIVCKLVHAYRREENRDEIPKTYDHVQLGTRFLGDRLQFITPSLTAAKEIINILLCSGSHLMLVGPRGGGKTTMINDLLTDLHKNNLTPELIRARLVSNLLAILSNRSKTSTSVGASLDKMRRIISKLSSSEPIHDDDCDFSQAWQVVQNEIRSHWSEGARNDCVNKTVYTALTTLRGPATAGDLRSWLEREFATEVKDVLEAPGYTHALAFVDDMHVVADESETPHEKRMVNNRPEALLKGLMDSTPIFGIKKNFAVMHEGVTCGGRSDGQMERGDPASPVLHRPCLTDPREKIFQSEEYTMQSIGIVGAATGTFHKLIKSSRFSQNVKSMAFVGLPLMNVDEIHVSLITGAFACMRSFFDAHQSIDWKGHIVELSRFLMITNSKIIGAQDSTNTTDLEKAIRTLIVLNTGMVSRFCMSLGAGCSAVQDAGGLLQLYSHEWRRHFLDPLPSGAQRERLVALYTSNLDTADPKFWSVTDDWMQDLIVSFQENGGNESVWSNPLVFRNDGKSAAGNEVEPKQEAMYIPMELNHLLVPKTTAAMLHIQPHSGQSQEGHVEFESTPLNTAADEADLIATAEDVVVEVNELSSDLLPQSILYPAATSMLLRLVRILSSMKRYILLSGFHGTTRKTAVTLAGKICGYKVRSFDVKENNKMGVVDPAPSDRALSAVDFRRFLRSVVWQCSGFCKVVSHEEAGSNANQPALTASTTAAGGVTEYLHSPVEAFEVKAPERVLVLITGAQQLSSLDRSRLLKVFDYADPCSLFDDDDMLKMSQALRADFSKNMLAKAEAESVLKMQEAVEETKLEDENVNNYAGNTGNPEPIAEAESMPVEESTISKKQDFAIEFAKRFRVTLSGNGYQWVQRRLKASIHDMLALALDADMPRAMELTLDTTAAAESAINPNDKRHRPAEKSSAPTAPLDAKDMQARIEEHLQTIGQSRRFSLLSRHHLLGERSQTSAVKSSTAVLNDEDEDVSEEKAGEGGAEYKLPRIEAPHNTHHGLLTCSILSPMIASRFCPVWYDIEGLQAIRGVCHALLKPPHELHFSTHDTNEIVLSFETSNIGDPLGAWPQVAESPVEKSQEAAKVASEGHDEGEQEHEDNEDADVDVDADVEAEETQDVAEQEVEQRLPPQQIAQSFQVSVRYEKKLQRLFDFLSIFCKEGIFQSFAHPHDSHHSFGPEDVIGVAIAEETGVLIDEAKMILPHLLCVPCVSDALLVSEPVITLGPERMAEVASHLVAQLISKGCECLMRRQHVLQVVLPTLWEGLDVVDSRAAAVKTITAYLSEITQIQRKLSAQKQHVVAELAQVSLAGRLCPEYETEQMLAEECLSLSVHHDDIGDKADKELDDMKSQMLEVDHMEWQGLAAIFVSGAERDKIELMRAVMILLGYTPTTQGSPTKQKGKKGKKRGAHSSGPAEVKVFDEAEMLVPAITMDSDTVARQSVGLLRMPNLAALIGDIDPLSLSPTQIGAMRNICSDQTRTREEKLQRQAAEHEAEGEFAPKSRPKMSLMENPIPHLIHNYLTAVILYVDTHAWIEKDAVTLSALQQEHAATQESNARELAAQLGALRDEDHLLTAQIHDVDAALVGNRAKLDALSRIESHHDEIQSAIHSAFTYVDAELHQIEDTLSCLVADSCVAAVVLVKAGWLPEQLRQECMEQLRKELHGHAVRVSDTPFIMGCLTDRMQIHSWMAGNAAYNAGNAFGNNLDQSHGGIPCDPSAINALSLVSLCPMYCYIIDQEGAAASVICDTTPPGYEQCFTSALKFSIAQLESWVAIAREVQGPNAALSIVISDAQAGLSDDLIVFLSAELFVRQKKGQSAHSPAGNIPHSAAATASWISWQDTVKHYDLIAELNPTEGELRNLNYDEIQASTRSGNQQARSPTTNTHHHRMFINLCRIRVILTSTRAPTMDAEGTCRPLPSCCLKNMTIIQWPTSSLPGVHVESQPLSHVQEKENVAEQFLACKMAAVFTQTISPQHGTTLAHVARNANKITGLMYAVENKTIANLHEWVLHERTHAHAPLNLPGLVKHEAVSLGFLLSESRAKMLVYAQADRNRLSLELDAARSYERELLAYRTAVEDIFSMSIEFLRMCGCFLPQEVLPPYALSPTTIAQKCISTAVKAAQHEGLLHHVPSSLDKADSMLRGFQLLQRKSRGLFKPHAEKNWNATLDSGLKRAQDQRGIQEGEEGDEGDERDEFTSLGSPISRTNQTWLQQRKQDEITMSQKFSSSKQSGPPGSHSLASSSSSAHISSSSTVASANPQSSDLLAGLVRLPRSHGLPKNRRGRAVQAFHFLTQPLRTFFLGAVVEYVQQAARPGMEWIVKFLLLLTTWSQSYPMHTEQLRALFHLVHQSIGSTTLRYGLHISYDREDVALQARLSTCRERKYSLQFDRRVDRRSILSNTMENLIRIDSPHKDRGGPAKIFKTSAAIAHAMSVVKNVRWMSRGHGWVDGMLMNRRSDRWRIKYVPSTSFAGHAAARPWSDYYNQPSMAMRHDTLMLDQDDALIVMKSSLVAVRSRAPDKWECEWLQLLGVKLFCHASSAQSNLALGVPDANKKKSRARRGGGSAGTSLSAPNSQQLKAGENEGVKAVEKTTAPFAVNSEEQESKAASVASSVLAQKPQVVRRETATRSSVHKKRKPLEALLTTHQSRVSFHLLSEHSALSRVFQGMGTAMLEDDRVDDFIAWKEKLKNLPLVDILRLDQNELLALLDSIRPPSFEPPVDSDDEANSGSFVQGFELSVIETMLLAEAVEPGSSGHIARVHFALVSSFIEMKGRIVKNLDEKDNGDEESFNQLSRKVAVMKPFQEVDEDEDEVEYSDDEGQESGNDQPEGREQPGSSLMNSWRKLHAVISGASSNLGPVLSHDAYPHVSKYVLTARAYREWEGVLSAVLSEEQRAEKFVFMREVKLCAQGGQSAIFLASEFSSNHMAVLSMHVRDFSKIVSKCTAIVNCSSRSSGEGHGVVQSVRQSRAHLVELQKAIRSAAGDALSEYKVVIEMADISTPTGNALVAAGLPWSRQGIRVKSISYDEAVASAHDRTHDNRMSMHSNSSSISYSGSMSMSLARQGSQKMNTPSHFTSVKLSGGAAGSVSAGMANLTRIIRADSESSFEGNKPAPFSDSSSTGPGQGTSVSLRYNHILAHMGKANAAFLSPTVPQAVFITSEWGSCHFGQGPLQPLGEMPFHWLPRFFLPDIVSTRRGSSHADNAVASGLPPSAEESSGILEQELEATLLWMLNNIKVLGRSTITLTLREKLKSASRIELRVTACVVVIWRLAHYVRSVKREEAGQAGLWSHCLSPINLWQLARLVIKTSDMISVHWTKGVVYTGGIKEHASSTASVSSVRSGVDRSSALSQSSTSSRFGRMSTISQRSGRNGGGGGLKLTMGQDWSSLTEINLLQNASFIKAVCLCVEPLGAIVKNTLYRRPQQTDDRAQSQKALRKASRAGLPTLLAGQKSQANSLIAHLSSKTASGALAAPLPVAAPPTASTSDNSVPRKPLARSAAAFVSPLAQYRRNRTDQKKLAEVSHMLLTSLSSVNRLLKKEDLSGATSTPAPGSSASYSQHSRSAKGGPNPGAGAAGAAQHHVDELEAVNSRIRAMTALFFAELSPQIRYHTQEEISRTDSFAGTGGFEGNTKAGLPTAKKGVASKSRKEDQSTNQNLGANLSKPMSGRVTKVQLAKMHHEGVDVTNEGFILAATDGRGSSKNSASASTKSSSKTTSSETAVADILGEEMVETWPTIDPQQHDVHLGGLRPADVVLFLVKWAMEDKK